MALFFYINILSYIENQMKTYNILKVKMTEMIVLV